MEQHPIPQNIAAFKFKLFGSLTARQFFTLIIPLSVAALIFFSNVPVLIRMPLSLILGIIAFVVALVPINGQPFDKWAVAFIRAVMSPTQRVWVKDKKVPDFLNVIVSPPVLEETIPEELSNQKKAKLLAYIRTLPRENATPLDVREQIALEDIDYSQEPQVTFQPSPKTRLSNFPPLIIWPTNSTTFEQVWYPDQETQVSLHPTIKPFQPSISAQRQTKPQVVALPIQPPPIRVNISKIPTPKLAQINQPRFSDHAKPYVLHGIEKRLAQRLVPQPAPLARSDSESRRAQRGEPQYVESIKAPSLNLASDTNYSLDNIIPIKTPDNKITLLHGIGKTRARKLHFAPPANFDLSKLPIRGEKRFEVSDELKRHFQFEDTSPDVILPIERKTGPTPQIPAHKTKSYPNRIPTQSRHISESPIRHTFSTQLSPDTQQTDSNLLTQKFSVTDLKKDNETQSTLQSAQIIPLTETPNVISGQVIDTSLTPLSGAVIVVRDSNGIPVRALKTNKLGQFLSATPLATGTYTIETESESNVYKPIRLDLKGEIVPPIAITAEEQKVQSVN